MAIGTRGLLEDRVRKPLSNTAFFPGWLILGVTTLLFLAGLSVPQQYQWIPLIASVVLFGLPHGAVDHLALPRLYGDGLTLRWVIIVVGLYAVVGGAYTVLWFVAPAAAFVIFILITWFHWGQGELYPLRELAGGGHLRSRRIRWLTVLVRGAMPMAVPLVAFPAEYRRVAEYLISLYDPAAVESLSVFFSVQARMVVAALVGGLIIITFALGYQKAQTYDTLRPWLIDLAEILLLIAFFATVPPILAIGLYFCFWHAIRHIARLIALDRDARHALRTGAPWTAAWRFIRDATPLTVVSIVLLGGLYALTPGSVTTIPELVALYLVLIAVLTLPHVVVVSWMDRIQGLLP